MEAVEAFCTFLLVKFQISAQLVVDIWTVNENLVGAKNVAQIVKGFVNSELFHDKIQSFISVSGPQVWCIILTNCAVRPNFIHIH